MDQLWGCGKGDLKIHGAHAYMQSAGGITLSVALLVIVRHGLSTLNKILFFLFFYEREKLEFNS